MSTERNYSGIGDKMLSEGNMDRKELQKVLDIGLDFISEEINGNMQILNQVARESSDFQIYFPYATLVRLVHQYQDAKEANLTGSDSYKMFGKMKNYFIDRLGISENDKENMSLENKIVEITCCNPDLFGEEKYIDSIGRDMPRLAILAAEIVPNNPKINKNHKIDHPLD